MTTYNRTFAPAPGSAPGNDEETFIQRQKRLAGEQNKQLAGGAFHAGNATPVTGNGKIPEPTPPQPAQIPQSTPQTLQAAPPMARPMATLQPTQPVAQQPGQVGIPASPVASPGNPYGGITAGMGQPTEGRSPREGLMQTAIMTQPSPVTGAANGNSGFTGGFVTPTEGTTPRDTKQAPQQQQQTPVQATNPAPQQIPGSPVTVPGLGNDPFVTYKGYDYKTAVPTPGQLPGSYTGTQFTQFNGPNQEQLVNRENTLMSAILDNPRTLNDAVLSQMKEKGKEGSLLMEQQLGQQAREMAAARGMTNGGGLAGTLADIKTGLANDVLASNRDLDIRQATQNREDELAALSAVEGILSGQMGRATQGFGATLAGQSAQAGDSRSVAQDAIQRAIAGNQQNLASAELGLKKEGMQAEEGAREYTSNRSAQDAALDRILKQFGMTTQSEELRRANEALKTQRDLGEGGLAVDRDRVGLERSRLDSQNRQFDKGYGLDVLRFLEGQRQSDNGLGFNYAQLNNNGQNSLMDFISRILG